MHFKWDSNVARDITSELNRLEQELSDCSVDMDHCAAILRQMQGGGMDKVIEKYISLTDKLRKGLKGLEDRFSDTGRGINRATEMFENVETALRSKADGMTVGRSAESIGADAGWRGTPPLFYNVSSAAQTGPIGLDMAATPPWPALESVSQTVIIDQVSLNNDVLMPPWLQGIIDADSTMY